MASRQRLNLAALALISRKQNPGGHAGGLSVPVPRRSGGERDASRTAGASGRVGLLPWNQARVDDTVTEAVKEAYAAGVAAALEAVGSLADEYQDGDRVDISREVFDSTLAVIWARLAEWKKPRSGT